MAHWALLLPHLGSVWGWWQCLPPGVCSCLLCLPAPPGSEEDHSVLQEVQVGDISPTLPVPRAVRPHMKASGQSDSLAWGPGRHCPDTDMDGETEAWPALEASGSQ